QQQHYCRAVPRCPFRPTKSRRSSLPYPSPTLPLSPVSSLLQMVRSCTSSSTQLQRTFSLSPWNRNRRARPPYRRRPGDVEWLHTSWQSELYDIPMEYYIPHESQRHFPVPRVELRPCFRLRV